MSEDKDNLPTQPDEEEIAKFPQAPKAPTVVEDNTKEEK